METTVYTIGGKVVSEEEWNEYVATLVAEFEEEEYGRLVLQSDNRGD